MVGKRKGKSFHIVTSNTPFHDPDFLVFACFEYVLGLQLLCADMFGIQSFGDHKPGFAAEVGVRNTASDFAIHFTSRLEHIVRSYALRAAEVQILLQFLLRQRDLVPRCDTSGAQVRS
jgi:hypothetical protein